MFTLPAYFSAAARHAPLLYVVGIIPGAGDTWTIMLFGTRGMLVQGAAVEGGLLSSVGSNTQRADISRGGAAASSAGLAIEFVDGIPLDQNPNNKRLHELLFERNIEGREVSVFVALDSPNQIRNSSFEDYTVNDADFWTENAGTGTIVIDLVSPFHGLASFDIVAAGATAPRINSNNTIRDWKRGEDIILSVYAKADSGTPDIELTIKMGSVWWNESTQLLSGTRALNRRTITTSWVRYEMRIPAAALHAQLAETVLTETVNAEVGVPDAGDQANIDAVMVEFTAAAHLIATPYVDSRDFYLSEDVVEIFRGTAHLPKWRHGQVTLQVDGVQSTRHKEIPTEIIQKSLVAGELWDVPPKNKGIPFPMTYGDLFFRVYGTDVGNPGTVDRIDIGDVVDVLPRVWPRVLAMGRLVNTAGMGRRLSASDAIHPKLMSTGPIVYFDRPGIKLNEIGLVYHYSPDADRYLQETGIDNYPSATTYQWEKLPDLARVRPDTSLDRNTIHGQRVEVTVYMRPSGIINNAGPASERIIDAESLLHGNYATHCYSNVSNPAAFVNAIIQFEQFTIADTEILEAYYILQAKITGGTSSSLIDFTTGDAELLRSIQIIVGAGPVRHNNCPWTADDPTDTPTAGETAFPITRDDETGRLDYWNQVVNITSPPTHRKELNFKSEGSDTVRVHEFAIRLELAISLDNFIPFAAIKGREYQDTWGSRKTAGNLIENFADLIESILRDELTVAGTLIETTAFDAVNTARTSWKAAGQVVETTESEDVVHEVCQSGGLIYFVGKDGKETVRSLDYTATPDKTLTLRHFRERSITVEYTPASGVVTDYVLHYAFNPSTGEFAAQEFCSRLRTSLDMDQLERCRAGFDALGGIDRKREFRAYWINDEPTAKLLLEFLINWNIFRRLRVKGMAFLDSLGLELGDRVKLMDFENYLPSNEEIYIVEESKLQKGGTLKLSLLETKDPAIPVVRKAWVTGIELSLAYTGGADDEVKVFPNADATSQDWNVVGETNAWETLKEGAHAAIDGTHITIDAIVEQTDVFFGNTPGDATTITDILMTIRAQINDPSPTADISVRLFHSGSTQVTGSPKNFAGTDFGGYGVLGTARATFSGLSLTKAQADSLEARIEFIDP